LSELSVDFTLELISTFNVNWFQPSSKLVATLKQSSSNFEAIFKQISSNKATSYNFKAFHALTSQETGKKASKILPNFSNNKQITFNKTSSNSFKLPTCNLNCPHEHPKKPFLNFNIHISLPLIKIDKCSKIPSLFKFNLACVLNNMLS
jgi:hypothetical protein